MKGFGQAINRARVIMRDMGRLLAPKLHYNRSFSASYLGFAYLYERLGDKESKRLLVDLIAFRLAGHHKIKLSRNDSSTWEKLDRIRNLPSVGSPLRIAYQNATLKMRDFLSVGFAFRAYATDTGAAIVLLQKQYAYSRDGVVCRAEPGDIAIDAGGCWGETALFFAEQVGSTGGVIVFEFIPDNLEVLRSNIDLNPHLASRVTIIERPLWDCPERDLYYVDWGPGSRVSLEKLRADFADTKVVTTTIDETVRLHALKRLDFIKMDIEGAELAALKGGERSIRRFRPKLAISLYHALSDFEEIPRFIDSLMLDYDFHLDHHTIYENETVLFCVPK